MVLSRWLGVVILSMVPTVASAGVLFEMRTYEYDTGETETSIGFAHQGQVKLGLRQETVRDDRNRYQGSSRRVVINEGNEVIFRPGRGNRLDELILIDHNNRSYQVINENNVPNRRRDDYDDNRRSDYDDRGQIDVFSLFAEALQNAARDGDETREPTYRGTNRWQNNRRVDIRQTRRTEQSWFGTCVIWERYRRGNKTHEVCAVDPLRVELGSAILSETQPMAEFFQDVVARIGREMRGMVFGLAGVNGFPVITRTYDRNGQLISEREFIRAREARLHRRNFLPPKGYRYDRGY